MSQGLRPGLLSFVPPGLGGAASTLRLVHGRFFTVAVLIVRGRSFAVAVLIVCGRSFTVAVLIVGGRSFTAAVLIGRGRSFTAAVLIVCGRSFTAAVLIGRGRSFTVAVLIGRGRSFTVAVPIGHGRSFTVAVLIGGGRSFTVSWHRDGPAQMLADFSGTLVADCYSGYEGIALGSNGRIRRAACSSHARRKVFDAKDAYPVESSLVLAKFQQLYDIEDQANGMSPGERAALRQSAAAKVWDSLDEWLRSDAAARVLPKSKFGEALGYIRNQWKPLQTYLSDGRVPLDNNEVEQLMKQVALGRKNWLFIGSVPAGQRAADFITLVSSAWRNDLDVWSYIKDVLDRLLAGETDYAALRPDVWRHMHPEAIREYRVSERRDRADRKQYRRAARRRNTPKTTH